MSHKFKSFHKPEPIRVLSRTLFLFGTSRVEKSTCSISDDPQELCFVSIQQCKSSSQAVISSNSPRSGAVIVANCVHPFLDDALEFIEPARFLDYTPIFSVARLYDSLQMVVSRFYRVNVSMKTVDRCYCQCSAIAFFHLGPAYVAFCCQGWAPAGFFSHGWAHQRSGDESPPAESRDGAPEGVWGKSPRSRRQVVKILCINSLSAERFTVTNNAQNTLQHFQRVGGGASALLLLPLPMPAGAHVVT